MKTKAFFERIGGVRLPEAEEIMPQLPTGLTPDPQGPDPLPYPERTPHQILERFTLSEPIYPLWPYCFTKLREGCYTLSFQPKLSTIFGPHYRGTLRVERLDVNYRISADVYRRWRPWLIRELAEIARVAVRPELRAEYASDDAADTAGTIPIYPRREYYSYLKGTGAVLVTKKRCDTCWFALSFDEYRYEHPASGFSGTFPSTPDRSLRFVLNRTGTQDFYSGKAYLGNIELGNVSIRWVSPYFRRATLQIHTLDGAEAPQPVTSDSATEDFRTIFETAGWDLTVCYAGTISLPASLVGVQDPDDCWTKPNSAELMESVTGYDPSELDSVWKARLLSVPAELGCSRGRMFDNGTGDTNDVPREGAVTHSHDGYPSTDTCGQDYGLAADQLQKDHPRAFLRSAAHEVGHTFNQIHQWFEGGSDNSIMTVTPCVSGVIDASGGTFPDDINLSFNETVRRHLIHLPDPAVRPGAMDFFGAAVTAPEADQVAWFDELALEVKTDSETVQLGEPLSVSWKLTNIGKSAIVAPSSVDIESLTARVSVTDPGGRVTFMRPLDQEVCARVSLKSLKPKDSVEGSTTVFWGRDGFLFETPGRHTLEVIVLWQESGFHIGAEAETTVWVDYPLTDKDNRIAALLLNEDVGRAVASGGLARGRRAENAASRINQAVKIQKTHAVVDRFHKLGLVK